MKKFRIQNVSGGILWCLFIITIIVFAAFFFGGETDPANRLVADTSYSEPAQTDTLLYWVYFLIIAAVVVTVLAFVIRFFADLKDSPKAALQSLVGVIALVVLMVVTYSVGSNEPLQLVGYTGDENTAPWLAVADMFIYTIGFLVAVMIVLMIGSGIKKRIGM